MPMPLRSITAAISAFQSPASAAAFSCMAYEDMNAAEQTICDNHWLGALDERLDSWYRRAKIRVGYFDQTEWLRSEQLSWLADRDACGSNVHCMKRTYRSRIRELKNYVKHV